MKFNKAVSLFDGIGSIWQVLKELDITVDEAYSYEINKYAIQVCQNNHPEVKHMGDVIGANFKQHRGAELVVGGFPCTDLSIAKKDRKGLAGEHSSLFWELVRAIDEIHPRYFLVENNASMPKADRDIITQTLEVEPIMINSSLVSAQQRKRLYWTNIPNVCQPENRGIILADILESGICDREKSLCVTAAALGNSDDYFKRKTRQAVFEPVGCAFRTRQLDFGRVKKLEIRKDKKSNALTTVNTDCMVCQPICINSKSGRGNNHDA